MIFRRTIITVLMFYSVLHFAYSQFNETFADSAFNASGLWQGTLGDFSVNASHQGVLNATGPGYSYMLTQSVMFDSTIYSYYLKVNFASSTQNFTEFYLQLNDSNPDLADGYILRIGETGSNDGLQLFYRHAQNDSLIARGGDGLFANAYKGVFNYTIFDGILTVTFTPDGGSQSLLFQTFLTHWTNQGSFTGLGMKYTSSNTKNILFDDISLNRFIADTAPPEIASVTTTQDMITVLFNESMDPVSAVDTSNFSLRRADSVMIPIASIEYLSNGVAIYPSVTLQANSLYHLYLSNLKDLSGNILHDTVLTATYSIIIPEPLDILINEIMADPSPVVGLPDAEYIELYNRSNKVLNLSGTILKRDDAAIQLPEYTLDPDSYVILTSTSSSAFFQQFGNVLGISSFPSIYNDGSKISLISRFGEKIHSVTYNTASYQDATKANGGWSLEYAGDQLICYSDPFIASNDPSGGTPGRKNSDHSNTASAPLKVTSFQWDGGQMISLCFNQLLMLDSNIVVNGFSIKNTSLHLLNPGTSDCFTLLMNPEPKLNVLNMLRVVVVADCQGNKILIDTTISFGSFDPPGANDLLISEILFDPDTGGKDYLELYNNSNHILDISNLIVGNTSNKSKYKVGQTIYLKPATYTVLTQDRSYVLNSYQVPNPNQLYQITNLPAFNQDKGNVSLYYPMGADTILIDSMYYTKSMYNVFLKNTKGISIERVDFNLASTDLSNWQSAASNLRGTPTGKNSQYRADSTATNVEIVSAEQDHLSPDGDGYLDYLLVKYKLDEPGYSFNWKVYDLKGRLVLGNTGSSQIAGVEGTVTWQGNDDKGNHVLPGIYILVFDFINNNGKTKKDKLTTVVSYH